MTLKLPKLKICTLDQKLWRCIFHGSCWCAQWTHHWIGFEKLPQNDTRHFEIHPLDQKLQRCQLMCTVTSLLDLPWKTTQKLHLNCKNLSTASEVIEMSLSKVMEISFFMSADVYSDHTIGVTLKNYPKMTPDTLKSIHWIRSYGDVFFHVSYSDLTIGLALKN